MIVFTEDHQFLKLPISDEAIPFPGETIVIDIPEESPEKGLKRTGKTFFHKYNLNKKWVTVAAMIMLIVMSMFTGKIGETSAAAYVNLDMKSSIQLEVDKNGVVQNINALNSVGKNLIDSINLKNMDLNSAIQEVIKRESSLKNNNVQNEAIVMVSVVHLSKSSTPIINEKQLQKLIHQQLKLQKMSGYIVINPTTKEEWEKANKSGYSMNEYMLMNHAKEHGVEINENQFHREEHGVTEYMVKNNVPVEQIFPNTSYEVKGAPAGSDHNKQSESHSEEDNVDHQQKGLNQHENPNNLPTTPKKQDTMNTEHNQPNHEVTPNTTIEEKMPSHEGNQVKQEQIDQNQHSSISPDQSNHVNSGTSEGSKMDMQERFRD